MAYTGPEPKPNKVGRTPNAEWSEVDDLPFLDGRARELPVRWGAAEADGATSRVELPWEAQTLVWWGVVRTLPHAALWTESDWLFATDTAYLKDSFYSGTAGPGEMVEMRRREDLLGLSAEARRKNRIRYRSPALGSSEAAAATGTDNVTPLTGRRSRRVVED